MPVRTGSLTGARKFPFLKLLQVILHDTEFKVKVSQMAATKFNSSTSIVDVTGDDDSNGIDDENHQQVEPPQPNENDTDDVAATTAPKTSTRGKKGGARYTQKTAIQKIATFGDFTLPLSTSTITTRNGGIVPPKPAAAPKSAAAPKPAAAPKTAAVASTSGKGKGGRKKKNTAAKGIKSCTSVSV